jgi:hypothetical protein
MKTLRILSIAAVMMAVAFTTSAQTKSDTLKVSGECGMCKKKIEKAAKDAGASFALWDVDTKILTVKYNSTTTNTAKIEQKIAKTGYDTPDYRAKDEDYKKLDKCCQYEREAVADKMMDCCKGGKCTKAGHDGKDCCKKEDGKMDCCKDGKCTKEGHTGGDCCKKAEQ